MNWKNFSVNGRPITDIPIHELDRMQDFIPSVKEYLKTQQEYLRMSRAETGTAYVGYGNDRWETQK